MSNTQALQPALAATQAEDFTKALDLWLNLHAAGSKSYSPQDWYTINFYVADTYDDLDENAAALPYYLAAEQDAPHLPPDERLELRARICHAALYADQEELATKYLTRILADLVDEGEGNMLFNIAEAYDLQAQNQPLAQQLYDQALTVATPDQQNLIIQSYWAIDDVLKEARQFDDRIQLADRCLPLLQEAEDQLLCHLNAIESLFYTMRLQEAMKRWPATDPYVVDLPDYPEMYQSLYFSTAGVVAIISEKPDEQVRQLLDEALRISRFNNEPIFPMKVAEQSTLFLSSANRHDLALEYGQIAIDEARKLPADQDPERQLAELAYDQATNFYNHNKIQATLDQLEGDVFPHFEQLSWEPKIGILSLATRAAFHLALGDEYAGYLQRYYDLEQQLPQEHHYAYFSDLGNLLAGTHQYEKAITANRRAIETADPQAHAHTLPYVKKELAKLHEDLGRPAVALQLLNEIDLSETDDDFLSDYYLVLGDIHLSLLETDYFVQAQQAYQRAAHHAGLLLDSSYRLSAAYNNLGRLYNYVERFADSLEYYQKSLALDEAAGLDTGLAIGYHNVGANYLQLKDYPNATASLLQALHLRARRFGALDPDATESRYVSDEYNNTIELLVRSLLHEQKVDLAYRYALYARSVRSEEEVEAIPSLPLPSPTPGQAILTYVGARGEVLCSFVHTADRLEASFVVIDPLPPDLTERLDRFRANTHQADKRQKNYFTHLPDLCRWYVSRLASPSKWRSSRSRELTRRIGRKLYEDLIGDYEQYLAGGHELLVVAEYTLALLPFVALVGRDDRWLVSRFTVSAPDFVGSRNTPYPTEPPREVLITGGVNYQHLTEKTFSDLPAGTLEATSI
ncbi:MAG: tetratricopeptide repeat protein, partial [Bacteroidota bacterium]